MGRGVKVGLGIAIVALVLGGLWFVVRDSGFVRVKRVEVIGLDGSRAARVRAAALDQTTLNVDEQKLRDVIGDRPPIKSMRVTTGFPDRMRIEVVLYQPVAVVAPGASGGVAVASDGTVLQGVSTANLPRISGTTAEGRVQEADARRSVAIVAAAPDALLARIETVRWDRSRGAVVVMRNGPELYFGTDDQLAAKWAAVVTVLADPSSSGARYIDVRVPRRPAVGGVAGGVQGGIDPADPNQALGNGGATPDSGTGSDSGNGDTGSTDGTDSGGGASPDAAAGAGQ